MSTKEDSPYLPTWALKVEHSNVHEYAAWLDAHRGKARELMMDRIHHDYRWLNEEEILSLVRILDQIPVPDIGPTGRALDAAEAYRNMGLVIRRPGAD